MEQEGSLENTDRKNRKLIEPNIWLSILLVLLILLTFVDFLYVFEKLIAILVIYVCSKYLFQSDYWGSNEDAIHPIISAKRFRFFLILSVSISLVLAVFSESIVDRYFSPSKLTLYYATEDFHFYEEATVTIKKFGMDGFGKYKAEIFWEGFNDAKLMEDEDGRIVLQR
jgi:hypothetical protein